MQTLLPTLLVWGSVGLFPAIPVDVLQAIGGLPAHLAGAFEDIAACHISPDGEYLVFDRRSHAISAVAPRADTPRKLVQIGTEAGRLLNPTAFDSAPNGSFVVADTPNGRQRIQLFFHTGTGLGGFLLPDGTVSYLALGDLVFGGLASLKYTGTSLLMSRPQVGALVTEYGMNGETLRTFGELRPTGQERDRDVHTALNTGLVLPIPGGGFYFVFRSGVPMFRKYDAAGRLLFERHIEGVELDQYVRSLPTVWPRRSGRPDELPVVGATVRAAAVDGLGNLWVSLTVPYTYVYDGSGDKRRTIQFRGAGVISPTSFFFTKDNRVLVTPGCYAFQSLIPNP